MSMRSPALALALAIVVAAGLAQTGTGHRLMQRAGLIGAPAAYTALYFTNPRALPTKVPSRHFALAVPFTIHNVSATARDYQWSVLALQGPRTRAAARGRLSVAPDRTANLDQPVSGFCTAGTLQLVIRLSAPRESIDFRASCRA